MKFRKLLGGGLLAAVLALGGVAGLATRSESKSVSAEGDRYYIRGDKQVGIPMIQQDMLITTIKYIHLAFKKVKPLNWFITIGIKK